jgi:hypothetical protein
MRPFLATAVPLAALALAAPRVAQTVQEETKLQAPTGVMFDTLGGAVAISGDRAIVAQTSTFHAGSVFVFERTAGAWSLADTLTASDGGGGGGFGQAVALSGDRAIVGAPSDASGAGSAYVYEYASGVWTEVVKLAPAALVASDDFGRTVAIAGDRAIVGAPSDDDLGILSGAAYVFERGPGGWILAEELHASDGVLNDMFGWSVAISGDRALVGARKNPFSANSSGSAYVFQRTPAGWLEQTKLVPFDGFGNDLFGYSVAIAGSRALVGAPHADAGTGTGVHTGAAYAFEEGAGGWAFHAKLSWLAGHASQGSTVSLSGERALLGSNSAAELFERDASGWVHRATLVGSDATIADGYGLAALSGGRAVVGAPEDGAGMLGQPQGAAYVHFVPEAACTPRGGILGLDPADFTCTSPPRIGTDWLAAVSITPLSGTSTAATIVATGLGGPTQGVPAFGFEVLALPPYAFDVVTTGLHVIAIPAEPALVGRSFTTQGARVELSPTQPFVVLTNALDLLIGL